MHPAPGTMATPGRPTGLPATQRRRRRRPRVPHELAGRRVYTRADLRQRTGRSLSFLEKLYRDRATNGHPEAEADTIQRAKVWDAENWDTWWTTYCDPPLASTTGQPGQRRDQQQDRTASPAGPRIPRRLGDAEDRITLSEVARELGMEPDSITKYATRPPRNFPAPDPEADVSLPSGRVRRHWRRGDIWDYAQQPSSRGRSVHHDGPTGSYPDYTGDYRLQIAQAALHATSPNEHPELPKRLAGQHEHTSAGTWANIIAAARRATGDERA